VSRWRFTRCTSHHDKAPATSTRKKPIATFAPLNSEPLGDCFTLDQLYRAGECPYIGGRPISIPFPPGACQKFWRQSQYWYRRHGEHQMARSAPPEVSEGKIADNPLKFQNEGFSQVCLESQLALDDFLTVGVEGNTGFIAHPCDRVYAIACSFVMVSDSQPHSWQR
jgi:hypothetical protein